MRLAWVFLLAVACDEPSDGADPQPGGEAGEAGGEAGGEGEGEGEAGDPDPEPAPEPEPEPIIVSDTIDYLADLNVLRCKWAVKCETQARATLREVQRVACGSMVRDDFDLAALYNGGLAAERLEFDREIAQACLRELAEVEGCAELWERHTAAETCPGALTGLQEHGGACTVPEECGADGRCFFEGACPGVCIKGDDGLSLNGECELTPQCVEGLRCIDGVCRLARLEGEECAESSECATGLHCAEKGEPAGTCTPIGKLDEPCFADLEAGTSSSCVGDLVCSGARRDHEGRCQTGLEVGDACSSESPCRVGARCIEDRCQEAVAPGELFRQHGQCPAGLGCYAFECKAAGLKGERCDRERPCDQGICRNEECAFLPAGAECEARSNGGTLKVCPDGFYCGIAAPAGEGEGEGEAEDPEEPAVPTCIEGPGFGEACIDGPIGGLCKEVLRCHGGFCGRPCVP